MTDDQARRVAQLNARRSASQQMPGRAIGSPVKKEHKARKSRAAVLGLSVAAVSGLVSGMWTQAAVANAQSPTDTSAQPSTDTALQPVLVPGQPGQPDRIVYLVVTRPSSSSGSNSLRSTTTTTQPSQTQVPSQAVTPAPRVVTPAPVTRSHGSR
jgi:hypothetical protein